MRFAKAALVVLPLLVSCTGTRKEAARGTPRLKPLNLVLVTIDTLRADRLHCYGNAAIGTPTLDTLAGRGVLFEHAVAQAPLTPPSHASIFTGTYPNVHKVRNTGGFVLQPFNVTLAEILHDQGWDTAAFIGAAVLKKMFGFSQGFAVYDDQMIKPAPGDIMREDPERPAADVVNRALSWLAAQNGKPYFLWVHLFDPHLPYEPPSPFREKYKQNPYDGEVAYVDRELGRLFDAVNRKPSAAGTLTVVLADHGESLSDHGEYTHGIFLYDATLHIPFLMAGPGVPAGVRVPQQVRTIDVLPTILDLMGGKPPAACQGVTLTPAFSGRDAGATYSYSETLYPKMNMGWAELRGVRTARWKYIRAPRPELYDLAADPGEKTNVLDSHPKEFRELESQFKALSRTEGTEKVETSTMDERSMEQLKSLGYLSGFAPKEVELNGQGADPKDRTAVLAAFEYAAGSRSHGVSPARRLEYLKKAAAEDPQNAAVYYYLGAEYERTGRYADAMRLYEGAIAKGVRNGKLYARVGDLYLRQGRKDEAISAYEQAARYNPTDFDSQANMATAYLERGRAADAEHVFRWILSNEENATAYNGLGLIAIGQRNLPAARTHFEHAVSLDPDLVEAQLNLGLIYKMAGDAPRARTCFEKFLAKAPRAQYAEVIPKVKAELAAMP